MITVEYRLPLPLSLSEYNRALRYVVARVAESTAGENPGEGVEIQLSEPFAPGDVPGMSSGGMHTVKALKFRSRLPALLRRVIPHTATEIMEESWFSDGEASRCKTVYKNPFLGERFKLCIESNHVAGVCTEENAVGLGEEDLARREVIVLDIASNVPRKAPCEDPTEFLSEKTGRGKLVEGWFNSLIAGGSDERVGVGSGSAGSESEGSESGSEAYASAGEAEELGVGEMEGRVVGAADEQRRNGRDDGASSSSSYCTGEDACDDSLREAGMRAAAAPDASLVPSVPGGLVALSSSVSATSSTSEPAPCMTCYKVVKMEFTGFGLRRFVQRWTTRAVVPNSLIDIHRKIYCWMDEWCDLSRREIEELEEQTAEVTRAKMSSSCDDVGAACGVGVGENEGDSREDEAEGKKKGARGMSALDYEYY